MGAETKNKGQSQNTEIITCTKILEQKKMPHCMIFSW